MIQSRALQCRAFNYPQLYISSLQHTCAWAFGLSHFPHGSVMLGFKREKKDEDDSLFEVSDKIDKRLTAGTPNRKFQQGSITLSFTPTTVDVATKLNVTDRTTLVHETITERRQLVTPTRCRTHRYRRKHLKASHLKA